MTYMNLDDKEHFVTVKFDVTNKGNSDVSAPALFWKLHASNGQIYSITSNAENLYPDKLQGGAIASYVLVFAVADGETPTKVVYNGTSDLEITL